MILDAHPEQLLQRLYSACVRVARDFGAPDSAWERVPMEVPPAAFGPGSLCAFARYFEGDSRVVFFDGNYTEYEADRRARLGAAAEQPHRIKYRHLTR